MELVGLSGKNSNQLHLNEKKNFLYTSDNYIEIFLHWLGGKNTDKIRIQ